MLPALAAFAFTLTATSVLNDGDTYWHIATGQWILAHRRVPPTDPFSYTALGHPWVTHEWLSEVLMALAYVVAGWSGVQLIIAIAAGATMALLATELKRSMGAISVAVALSLSFWVLYPHVLARPHMIALPLLVLWLVQLMKARRADRLPPLWLLPVMTLWANLHGSYIFGLAFTCPFALEAFLAAKGRRLRVAALWGGFIVAATAMALITPNGFDGLIYPIKVMSMKHLQAIEEWKEANFQKPSRLRPRCSLSWRSASTAG